MRVKTYTVRVTRTYEEEYVDIEVRASSDAGAIALAEIEARANSSLYFDQTPVPEFNGEIDED